MTLLFFATPAHFKEWLHKNHKTETELWVGYYKTGTQKPSMTWSQSVDEALCYGWIDGVRNSIDNESYCNRFTPRRATSNWSDINIKKVETLIKEGRMQPAGLEIYRQRKETKSRVYSFETAAKELNGSFSQQFKANKKAWEFFSKQAPSYQRTVIHWITTAKKEETKLNRLAKAITESEKQKRLF